MTLKDFEKPYFIADGQVDRPGKYDLRGDTTLTQAIAIAGGFKDAPRSIRKFCCSGAASEGWYSAKIINVKKWDKEGDPERRSIFASRGHAVRASEHNFQDQTLSSRVIHRSIHQPRHVLVRARVEKESSTI